jgi:hypothetical protein
VKYIIEMPDKWTKGKDLCFMCRHAKCIGPQYCPLANAKEAVELDTIDTEITNRHSLCEWLVNGKPVTLFAVTKEK